MNHSLNFPESPNRIKTAPAPLRRSMSGLTLAVLLLLQSLSSGCYTMLVDESERATARRERLRDADYERESAREPDTYAGRDVTTTEDAVIIDEYYYEPQYAPYSRFWSPVGWNDGYYDPFWDSSPFYTPSLFWYRQPLIGFGYAPYTYYNGWGGGWGGHPYWNGYGGGYGYGGYGGWNGYGGWCPPPMSGGTVYQGYYGRRSSGMAGIGSIRTRSDRATVNTGSPVAPASPSPTIFSRTRTRDSGAPSARPGTAPESVRRYDARRREEERLVRQPRDGRELYAPPRNRDTYRNEPRSEPRAAEPAPRSRSTDTYRGNSNSGGNGGSRSSGSSGNSSSSTGSSNSGGSRGSSNSGNSNSGNNGGRSSGRTR